MKFSVFHYLSKISSCSQNWKQPTDINKYAIQRYKTLVIPKSLSRPVNVDTKQIEVFDVLLVKIFSSKLYSEFHIRKIIIISHSAEFPLYTGFLDSNTNGKPVRWQVNNFSTEPRTS